MPDPKNDTALENGQRLIVSEPTLPDYTSDIYKIPIEKQYLKNSDNILLPLAGEIIEDTFQQQTAEKGFKALAKDLSRQSISLAGRKFPSADPNANAAWHTQFYHALDEQLKGQYHGASINTLDRQQLSSLIAAVIETFSVKDDKGDSFGLLKDQNTTVTLVNTAITRAEATKTNNPGNTNAIFDAISSALTIDFTKQLLKKYTDATDNAITALAVHYQQNILLGHAHTPSGRPNICCFPS